MIGYRRASRRYVLLLLVLTAITLITLDSRREQPGALGAVGRAAHTFVSPDRTGASNAVASPVGDWFDGVTNGGSLKRDNRRLLPTSNGCEQQQRRCRRRRSNRTRRCRQLLDLPRARRRPARHRARRQPFAGELRVDGHARQGRGVGDLARHAGDRARRVSSAACSTSWNGGSKVLLLDDPESNVGVRVQPGQLDAASPKASRARIACASTSTRTRRSTEGDNVVTSGLENSSFPEGLGVGTVVEVEQQPGGLGTVRARRAVRRLRRARPTSRCCAGSRVRDRS